MSASGAVVEEGPGETKHHACHEYKADHEENQDIFLAGEGGFDGAEALIERLED
jgi:hypothetical protein